MIETRHVRLAVTAMIFIAPALVFAQAASYPTRAVKVIVAVSPGGTPDILARLLSAKLSQRIGQQFIVENRVGAGGNIAAEAAAKAPADGYTLFFPANAVLTLNPAVYDRPGFDPIKDFAPISIMGTGGYFFLACPNVPARSMQEVVALAKQRPLTYATAGHGTSHHLAGEMLNRIAGIELTHVPYKGFGQGVTDALGCKVDLIVGAVASSLPYAKAGRLHALAVTSASRFGGMPEVPTMIESGFPGFEVDAWYSLLAPVRTPRPIIDRLNAEMVGVVKEKDMIERLREQGLEAVGNTPEEFTALLRAEVEKSRKLVAALGLKAD